MAETTRRTVLVVEDDEDSRIILSIMLSHSGFDVLEATDGAQGIARAREKRPDAIVMDISLPNLDGYEATRVLKADRVTSEIPVVVLTANALPSDRERALLAGADAFMMKPAEPKHVVAQIQELLDVGAA